MFKVTYNSPPKGPKGEVGQSAYADPNMVLLQVSGTLDDIPSLIVGATGVYRAIKSTDDCRRHNHRHPLSIRDQTSFGPSHWFHRCIQGSFAQRPCILYSIHQSGEDTQSCDSLHKRTLKSSGCSSSI